MTKTTTAKLSRQTDPVLTAFLDLPARDIDQHPERLVAISVKERAHAQQLTEGVSFDLAKPLSGLDDDRCYPIAA